MWVRSFVTAPEKYLFVCFIIVTLSSSFSFFRTFLHLSGWQFPRDSFNSGGRRRPREFFCSWACGGWLVDGGTPTVVVQTRRKQLDRNLHHIPPPSPPTTHIKIFPLHPQFFSPATRAGNQDLGDGRELASHASKQQASKALAGIRPINLCRTHWPCHGLPVHLQRSFLKPSISNPHTHFCLSICSAACALLRREKKKHSLVLEAHNHPPPDPVRHYPRSCSSSSRQDI